jgi:tetratricopeptide (TPR) repeat protein
MNLGRRDEALQMARRALDLYQSVARRDARDASFAADQARAQRTMAAILQDSEPAEALEFCRKAAAVDPGARAQMVHPLRKMGRLSEALATLQAVPLESLPDEDAILAGNESGDLQLELGHPEAASAQYRRAALLGEKAVRDKPYMMLLRARLADSYERLGRLHRSAEWYEKSLAIWRDWPNGGVSSSYDQRRRREVESLLFKLRSTIP